MKRLALILPFLFAAPLMAQPACTGSVCTAATLSLADVQAAWPTAGNTNATVTVNLPSGTGLWASQLTVTVPAAVTTIIIQGNTTVNCTGTAGTSGYACTPTDLTIIKDNITGASFGLWQINAGGGGASSSIRFTGITLAGGTGITKGQGLLLFYGPTDNLRIDHIHINENTYTGGPGSYAGRINGAILGVADHNVYDGTAGTLTQGFIASNTYGDTIGYGDGTWTNATPFGTSHNFFIESSIFNSTAGEDCDLAGAFVFRYNSILNGPTASSNIHNHGTKLNIRDRGCRSYEAYHNYLHNTVGSLNAAIGSSGGPSLVWGNDFSGYTNIAVVANPRNDGEATQTAPPNGWGYCGTASINPSTGLQNGAGSGWDGNSPPTTGWPCIDTIGRGQGQALNGQNWPNALNAVTGTTRFPNELLEPMYLFDNTFGGGNPLVISDISTQNNRDIYVDNPSFNGSTGTGSGATGSRPLSCTPGPGGTFGNSPTGTYGTGWFDTTTNTFYVCTANNVWTSIYTPYVYPHPLVSGGGGGPVATPTFSPVAGSYGPTQSVTISTSTAGATLCYTIDGTTPTADGAGTCTHGTTYSTPVSVASSLTLKAVGSKVSFTDSTVGSAAYVINGAVSAPTFSPVAGTYTSTQSVTISSSTGSSVLCYTTDGSTPTASAGTCIHGTTYTTPVSVSVSLTLKAIGTKSGFSNSSVSSAAYVIANVLATPTFTPPVGVPPVMVSIASSDQVFTTGIAGTEGSNSNASNGSAPSRNAYTNCAQSCSAGVPQPPNSGSVSHGQLWCNASQSTACGSFSLSSATSTITGTGTHQLANGLGAGGDDSLTTFVSTYGGAYAGACAGTSGPSQFYPSISLVGGTGSPETVFSGTTAATTFNTSLLAPTKWAFTSGDSYTYYIRQTCQTVPTTTGTGFHLEYDLNHTISTADYFGYGIHYNYTDSKWYYCFQGCSGWSAMKLVGFDGTVHTTLPFPAGHDIYTEFYESRTAACTSASGSDCEFVNYMCVKDFTAGGSLVCYSLIDAGTNLAVGGIPVHKSGFPPEFNLQHQLDYNQASITRSVNVHYDNGTAFSITGPTFCYTTDGSTPLAATAGTCSHGTTYTGPFLVSTDPTTVKTIATQTGKTNSAVATVTYASTAVAATPTFSPVAGSYGATQSVTISSATGSSTLCYTVDGTTPTGDNNGNCLHGVTYSTPVSVPISLTILAIATKSGFLDSAVGTAAYVINGTANTPTFSPVAGTYVGAQSVVITSALAGSTLCYTIDGSTPTANGGGTCTHGTTYSTAVSVSSSLTLKAIASKSGYTDSGVGSAAYVITAPPTVQILISNARLSGVILR